MCGASPRVPRGGGRRRGRGGPEAGSRGRKKRGHATRGQRTYARPLILSLVAPVMDGETKYAPTESVVPYRDDSQAELQAPSYLLAEGN